MYTIDLNIPKHVYFMGIGGISMSGLAQILKDRGFLVSGSDAKHSPMTERLEELGISIHYPQKAENIQAAAATAPIDVVVYTSAIHPDNPEFAAVVASGIPMLTRAELLGQIMQAYKMPVAISGTHGKTTTTSMISKILLEADTDPTLSIGGVLKDIEGNTRIGHSDYFVAEACEYTNSFLSLFPRIGVVLNIDADHLDFFKDLDDIRHSFKVFSGLIPADGHLVINGEIENLPYITEGLSCPVVTYGLASSYDYYATDITYGNLGNASFTAHCKDGRSFPVTLHVPGKHNVYNALAAIATADLLQISDTAVQSGLSDFTGTNRRFEYKGTVGGVTIVDDYAHHPTEIRATLSAAANYPHKSLWCVFQPHTYTRTKALMHEFAEALSLADHVVLADIYAARETDNLGISSRTLQEEIRALGHSCDYFPSFDEIEKFLLKNCTKDDLLITMGAGDVVKIGTDLLGK